MRSRLKDIADMLNARGLAFEAMTCDKAEARVEELIAERDRWSDEATLQLRRAKAAEARAEALEQAVREFFSDESDQAALAITRMRRALREFDEGQK